MATTSRAIAVHDTLGAEVMRIDPSEGSIFRQPTWLDASTVAFSEVSVTGNHALIAADAETGDVVWQAEMETPPFYFSPAPRGSPHATTSLRNDPSGAGLIAETVERSGEVKPLSEESPFYTIWSPEGDLLAIHIAGRRLDVRGSDGAPGRGFDRGRPSGADPPDGSWRRARCDLSGNGNDAHRIEQACTHISVGSQQWEPSLRHPRG